MPVGVESAPPTMTPCLPSLPPFVLTATPKENPLRNSDGTCLLIVLIMLRRPVSSHGGLLADEERHQNGACAAPSTEAAPSRRRNPADSVVFHL